MNDLFKIGNSLEDIICEHIKDNNAIFLFIESIDNNNKYKKIRILFETENEDIEIILIRKSKINKNYKSSRISKTLRDKYMYKNNY